MKPFHRSKSVAETLRAVKGGYLFPVGHKVPLILDRSTFRHRSKVRPYRGQFFDVSVFRYAWYNTHVKVRRFV